MAKKKRKSGTAAAAAGAGAAAIVMGNGQGSYSVSDDTSLQSFQQQQQQQQEEEESESTSFMYDDVQRNWLELQLLAAFPSQKQQQQQRQQQQQQQRWSGIASPGASSSNSSSRSSPTPILSLTKQDAQALDLLNEDEVLVMWIETKNDEEEDHNHDNQMDRKRRVHHTAVCFTKIISDRESISSPIRSSPYNPAKQSLKQQLQQSLTPGCCHIHPPPLIVSTKTTKTTTTAIPHSEKSRESTSSPKMSTTTTTTSTPTTPSLPMSPPPPPPPSSLDSQNNKKTNFSFARGGGGDSLIASASSSSSSSSSSLSSPKTTPILHRNNKPTTPKTTTAAAALSSNRKSKKLSPTYTICLIPLFNPLGQQLLTVLAKPCTTIQVTMPTTTTTTTTTEIPPVTPTTTNVIRTLLANHLRKHSFLFISPSQQQQQQQQYEKYNNDDDDDDDDNSNSYSEGIQRTISFQGKPLVLQLHPIVEDETTTTETIRSLERAMDQLRLDDHDNNNNSQTMKSDHDVMQVVLDSLQCRQDPSLTSPALCPLSFFQYRQDITTILFSSKQSQQQHQSMQSQDNQQNVILSPPFVAGLDPVIQQLKSTISAILLNESSPWNKKKKSHSQQQQQQQIQQDDDENTDDLSFMKPPRGTLIFGPHGVGKTMLLRQVAAEIQQEYDDERKKRTKNHTNKGGEGGGGFTQNLRIEIVSCASLQSHTSIIGEAERILSKLFFDDDGSRSNGNSPMKVMTTSTMFSGRPISSTSTLLLLDDIHLICPKRGNNAAGMDRLAATLLALLDGVSTTTPQQQQQQQQHRIYLLATTSDPSLLDPALRRPGRLDDEVEIGIPDESTRRLIWEFHLQKWRTNNVVDVEDISHENLVALSTLAKGFNGADCLLALKEATRMAVHKCRSKNRSQSSSTTPTITADNAVSVEIVPQPSRPRITLDILKTAIGVTKPSTISSITVEVPKVYWNSVGGMNSVKQKLREAIELPLLHADLFAKYHIPPPRGVLLYGPPGCSKTLMARALATEGKLNFLAVKGPELLSKWLGDSERALASLFRRARLASPCIIFFDEIDAIASKRGSSGSGGGERLLSQLLTELDGVGHTTGTSTSTTTTTKVPHVIVVAATNRPDLLDHALTRPGRIDRKIYVGLPDRESRAQIFEIGLRNKSHAKDINYLELASDEISGGFSGAELIAICRDAALLAIEEDDEEGMTRIQPPGTGNDDHETTTNTSSIPTGNSTSTTTTKGSLMICKRHLMEALSNTPRQVTQDMLDFYASYTKSIKV